MDIQNHFYGHTAALARYAGLPRPRHVAGLIQHGWSPSPPIPANFGDFPNIEKNGRRTLFVWSHVSRSWDPAQSPRASFPLGAPWAYLVSTAPVRRQLAGSRGSGVLIIPLHSSRIVEVSGDQGSLAQAYRRAEGPCTVCLHAEDIAKPDIVDGWLDAGHRVVTAGSRHDPDFLSRILGLILASERVVSNRLMTSVMYAASIGRDVGVYGDPLSMPAEIRSQEDIRSRWPELHGKSLDLGVTVELARSELGFQHVLGPVELRSALGWSSRSAGPAVQYWVAAPVHKAMNVLGLGERDPGSNEKRVGASPLAWLKHPMSHLPRPLATQVAAVDPLPGPIPVTRLTPVRS